MEPKEITLLTVFVLGVLYNVWKWSADKVRPKRIAIVEDDDGDFMMFKMFFHLDNVVIDRYKTADNLPLEFAKNRPDAVIADYYLKGCIKGDKLIQLCDKLRIPSRLVTGYEGDIIGVEPGRITRKSPEETYFAELQTWAAHQLA